MNLPTIVIGLLVLAVFAAIVGKGIWNKKHHKGGCGCGCEGCSGNSSCHSK